MPPTPDSLAFTTAARRTEAITFTLDGVEFHFTPPKVAGFVLPVVDDDEIGTFRGMMEWLGNGLPDDQEALLEARLRDPDDDLDVPDLTDIFMALVGRVGARPTPASSGS
jgi:hypothetical protein